MKQTLDPGDFRVPEGKMVDLDKWPTDVEHAYTSKQDYNQRLAGQVEELASLQRIHYAANRFAVLVIFQGMDAAGKDSAIRHVLSGVNPQGFQVFSFKQPSAEELEHDFLWRTTCRLPERGRIGIFNRSYYEDVLIVRVHPELLAAQGIPDGLHSGQTLWEERFRSIVDHEKHLHRNGTRIIKIFLHQSKDEQGKRFIKRIDDPSRNWKLDIADIAERELWTEYMQAYEACFTATGTEFAPWHIVPADDRKNSRLIISRIILEIFKGLDLAYPGTSAERRRELQVIRGRLAE